MSSCPKALIVFGNSLPSRFAFYCCSKHHEQKSVGEGRVYFLLQTAIVHHVRCQSGNSRQESAAGTEAEVWRSAACWLAQLSVLCNPGQSTWWHWLECALKYQPIISKLSQGLPTGYLMGHFLTWGPSFPVALACVKLTEQPWSEHTSQAAFSSPFSSLRRSCKVSFIGKNLWPFRCQNDCFFNFQVALFF